MVMVMTKNISGWVTKPRLTIRGGTLCSLLGVTASADAASDGSDEEVVVVGGGEDEEEEDKAVTPEAPAGRVGHSFFSGLASASCWLEDFLLSGSWGVEGAGEVT